MIFNLQYSWLKEFIDVPKDAGEVARALTLHAASVERQHHLRHEWTNIVVAEITKIEPHPNADKLQLATVTTGKGSDRLIVCGAPNIAVGQRVPLALPGAKLPGGLSIEKRTVRGVVSDGMLCSARELGIHDDHTGILVLYPKSSLGASLADLGSAQDELLEIEPTTNRPDLQSVIGIAREVSAIMKKPLKKKKTKLLSTARSPLRIRIEAKDICQRFTAVAITNVRVTSSPWWMQERLARAGVRPINAVVDITNYVMLEFGQPLHAFDRSSLGDLLVVRRARPAEKIVTLDGQSRAVDNQTLIVANDKEPVAIAGIMGGRTTSVTEMTSAVVLECATFERVSIRRSSRRLNLSTDASQLFEKGLSPEAPTYALARAVELILEICGGRLDGGVADWRSRSYRLIIVKFPLSEIKRLLGVSLSAATIKQHLSRLGFLVKGSGKIFSVTVPYWRDHDISIPEDIVEEVARLYGYHSFESILPSLSLDHVARSRVFNQIQLLREQMMRLGFVETISYSFIRSAWLDALHYDTTRALSLANPLASDLEFLRPSLIPSLVNVVEKNMAEQEELRLFEVGKVYVPGDTKAKGVEGYRREELRLAAVVSRAGETGEVQYRRLKGSLEELCRAQGLVDVSWQSFSDPWPFAEGSAAACQIGEERVGTIGILHPAFSAAFGVTRTVVVFNFSIERIVALATRSSFSAVPRFPAVKRDIALVAARNISYTDLVTEMRSSSELLATVDLFDIFRGPGVPADKQSLGFHLSFRVNDRTLTTEEVEKALAAMVQTLTKKFGVQLRS